MGRMKTSLDLPDELLIEAKKKVAEQRRSLRSLVEEGLRMVLKQPDAAQHKKTVRFASCRKSMER
jgi:hypothetical protein